MIRSMFKNILNTMRVYCTLGCAWISEKMANGLFFWYEKKIYNNIPKQISTATSEATKDATSEATDEATKDATYRATDDATEVAMDLFNRGKI